MFQKYSDVRCSFMKSILCAKKIIVLAVIAPLLLSACDKKEKVSESGNETTSISVASTPSISPDDFIADANKKLDAATLENNSAQWVYETYINDDSGLLAAKSNERFLTLQKELLA